MIEDRFSVQLIEYKSPEYWQACQLRYRLFYAEHDLPWEVALDKNNIDFHAAMIIHGDVVAYGQLIALSDRQYKIGQMVVDPRYQKQNLGKQIILFLIDLAKQQGASEITLNSRLTAVGFYQKVGFQPCGVQFPSPTTGVIHLPMNKKL